MVSPARIARLIVVVAAAVAAAACGGKGKTASTGPGGDSGGETADDCEPGRCLADVSARVEDRRALARACYDEGQKRVPELKGRLIINYEIDPDGKVVDASQSAQDEQIMDEQVVACIEDVIRGITFAKSERGKSTRAFHRYEFNPQD
jgi:hypothetical protein